MLPNGEPHNLRHMRFYRIYKLHRGQKNKCYLETQEEKSHVQHSDLLQFRNVLHL